MSFKASRRIYYRERVQPVKPFPILIPEIHTTTSVDDGLRHADICSLGDIDRKLPV
jgi:hypothetical protein